MSKFWDAEEGVWRQHSGGTLGPGRWGGWEDRHGRHAHPTHPVSLNEERRLVVALRNASLEVGFVPRNDGPELEVVPWPQTREDYCELAANVVPKRAPGLVHTFYAGDDGEELAVQPHHHRKRWSESQWLAFHEYSVERAKAQKADRKAVLATQWVVKDDRPRKPPPKRPRPPLPDKPPEVHVVRSATIEVPAGPTGLAFIRAEQRRLAEAERERDEARMQADYEKAQLEVTRAYKARRDAWLREMRKVRDET